MTFKTTEKRDMIVNSTLINIIFRTTKKHFKLFKCECRKWIRIFGLYGWEVYYFHEDDGTDHRAWASYKTTGRVCSLCLSTNWGTMYPTKRLVRLAAFHEVCELLLARMNTEAKYRFASEEVVDEAAHEVIRVLEKVVWGCGAKGYERKHRGKV